MIENPVVAFAHGYGWDEMPKGWRARRQFRKERRREKREGKKFDPTPGELSKFVMDAAALSASDYIGIAGGEVYKGYPPFSDTAQQYMSSEHPEVTVINFGKAWTSSTEVRAVEKGAIKKGLTDREIELIVAEPHEERMILLAQRASKKWNMKRRELRFKVRTAGSILCDPATYGGDQQKVKEAKERFAKIQKNEKYQKLIETEPFSIFLTRIHLERPLDFAFAIRRPRF